MKISYIGLSIFLICAAALSSASEKKVVIPDSTDPAEWSVNQDGGKMYISDDGIPFKDRKPSMRLTFKRDGYEWGNAAIPITLPANTTHFSVNVFVKSADAGAMFSMWLIEEDGDGHLVMIKPEDKFLSELDQKWIECKIPITAFKYDPRGNKIPQILTASKLLIGINSGKADISIGDVSFICVDNSAAASLNKTDRLSFNSGYSTRIGILKDKFNHAPGNSDPDKLASVLSDAGYDIVILKSGDLADRNICSYKNFKCIILPYGPQYPAAATETIKSFLKEGGSFISTGGYAFDIPCSLNQNGIMSPSADLITAEEVSKGKISLNYINTRHGVIGDTLGLNPDQIGVFDPSYMLNNVSFLKSADSQSIIPKSFRMNKSIDGYAASALLGTNNPVFPDKWGRYQPLIIGFDNSGRSKGPIGAMAYNYGGPYAKSSWAFFGATNIDLFNGKNSLLWYLPNIVDSLLAKTFLHSLKTEYACYHSGESVKISFNAANFGTKDQSARIMLTMSDRSGNAIGSGKTIDLGLKADSTESLTYSFDPMEYKSDLYKITAELIVDGKIIDRMFVGFSSYSNDIKSVGYDMNFENNYFRDKNTPYLLSGTNLTGQVFYAIDEDPLTWDRDLKRMNENGLNVVRILHFSPFILPNPTSVSVKPIDLNINRLSKEIERKLDSFIRLAQKHKIIVFLTAHDWMDLTLTNEELAAQKKFLSVLAERYRDVPGFMIDIQNEPYSPLPNTSTNRIPHIESLWNDYLSDKYKTDETLREAWNISPPTQKLGSIPFLPGSDKWSDMRTFDADIFRNMIVDRWIKENADGVKQIDSDIPVTVGFLQEYWALNKLRMMDRLDFANMHSYNPIEVLRADFKLFDRRFQGKSVSQGEFGALSDHDKRTNGIDNRFQDYNRYLRTGHYLFGEGGSFIANWCWKDMNDVVFPWGLNYTCDGSGKNLLKVYRNQSLLFRKTMPVYNSQKVFLVVPINSMTGGRNSYMIDLLYKQVDKLFDMRIDFGVIDDEHLDQLPASVNTLIYPAAFYINDADYDILRKFVADGGCLYISGDISMNQLRQSAFPERMIDLCGVKIASRIGDPGSENSKIVDVETVRATDESGIYSNIVGMGKVIYSPDIHSSISGGLLASLNDMSQIKPNADNGHVFKVDGIDGSLTYVIVNPAANSIAVNINSPVNKKVSINLDPIGTGLVRFNKKGDVIAIEFQNSASIGDVKLKGKGHFALISYDGFPIELSHEIAVVPFDAESLDIDWLSERSDMHVRAFDLIDGKISILSDNKAVGLRIPNHMSFDIFLISDNDNIDRLQEKVIKELKLQ